MKLFTTAQAAEYLGISYSSLLRLRRQGKGPKWVQLTSKGSIRYLEQALINYIKKGGLK